MRTGDEAPIPNQHQVLYIGEQHIRQHFEIIDKNEDSLTHQAVQKQVANE